jgi:hypothetical protein
MTATELPKNTAMKIVGNMKTRPTGSRQILRALASTKTNEVRRIRARDNVTGTIQRIAGAPREKEIVGSLNAELAKRYVAYVLLPPLTTLVLGLLGAWVVSSFERRGT